MGILTKEEIRDKKILFIVYSISFLLIINSIYEFITRVCDITLFTLTSMETVSNLIVIIATFSFTMTGFVAAMGTYIISISGKPSFKRWKNQGYLSIYKYYYLCTLTALFITFSLCVFYYLVPFQLFILKQILVMSVINLIHVMVITCVITGQLHEDT